MGICVYIHGDFFSMKHCVQTQLDLMHCMYMHMCKYMYIPDWFVLLHFGHSALLTMFVHTCTSAYVCTVQCPNNSVDNTFLHYRFLSYYVQYLQYIIYTTSILYIYMYPDW